MTSEYAVKMTVRITTCLFYCLLVYGVLSVIAMLPGAHPMFGVETLFASVFGGLVLAYRHIKNAHK
jgi:hypothetical protein